MEIDLFTDDSEKQLYAEVAINEPVMQLFTYKVPKELSSIRKGSIVRVPFGPREVKGCVVRLFDELPAELKSVRMKSIKHHDTPDYYVHDELLKLASWIASYYLAPPGDAVACTSFIGLNDISTQTVKKYRLTFNEQNNRGRLGEKQKQAIEVLESFSDVGFATQSDFTTDGISSQTIKTLVTRGIFEEFEEEVLRTDDYHQEFDELDKPLELTKEQSVVVSEIRSAFEAKEPATFLVHGVTGSGKTEVYLQSIQMVLDGGGDAIVLVPEISLTPQTVDRFRRRFGDIVGVYHSKMTIGQKFDLWRQIENGKIRIMVGARSAVFAPFQNLKMIVVDEEHESSYKQDSTPKYHGRDVAIMRAYYKNAVVILGSATPSIESYYKAETGKFRLLTLKERVDDIPMPEVEIINMTGELKDDHNTDLLSLKLLRAMDQAIERKDQVLLFLNRRGFFNFLICASCQKTVQCKHCDVALTYHKKINKILCHYCGREYVLPKHCPSCETGEMLLVGLGTQRLEEVVQDRYPESKVIRMDLDTTRQRNAFLDAWRMIESGSIDIILGTQMIAKGIHLENVTVVGVPMADVSFYQPDFRAAERGFSLLTQVAGRAGRGKKKGKVYIQTYVPDHYAIQFARNHDYVGFYKKEIRMREVLRFPPFYKLISVLAMSKDEEKGLGLLKKFTSILKDYATKVYKSDITVLGPSPAPLSRINDQYRWRVLIRGKNYGDIKSLYLHSIDKFNNIAGKSTLQIIPDIDPLDLL